MAYFPSGTRAHCAAKWSRPGRGALCCRAPAAGRPPARPAGGGGATGAAAGAGMRTGHHTLATPDSQRPGQIGTCLTQLMKNQVIWMDLSKYTYLHIHTYITLPRWFDPKVSFLRISLKQSVKNMRFFLFLLFYSFTITVIIAVC